MSEIDNIKGLSPEERIRKLREMEEKRKKELEEVNTLLKESEVEIEESIKNKRKTPIPQMKSIDPSTLFGRGTQEDIIFSAQRFRQAPPPKEEHEEKSELETIVMPEEGTLEQRTSAPTAEEPLYRASMIRYMPAEITLERVENISKAFRYDTTVTYEQKTEMLNEVEIILSATRQKMSDLEDGNYSPSEEASRALVVSYKAAKDLLDKYKW